MIVGITGRKYHGKDAIARVLVNCYGYQRVAFADPLKEACKILFGLTDEQCYGSKKEVVDAYWGVTPRRILQYMGTEIFREKVGVDFGVGGNFWVALLKREVERCVPLGVSVVVPDVRFQNEVDVIRELGGVVIRVKRPMPDVATDTHASEMHIDGLERIARDVDNDGTLEDLQERVEEVVEALGLADEQCSPGAACP